MKYPNEMEEDSAFGDQHDGGGVMAEDGSLLQALNNLASCERLYRRTHDLHGDGDIRTGRAWDAMRRAGDRARFLVVQHEELVARLRPIVLQMRHDMPANYRTPTQIAACCVYAGEPSPGATIPVNTERQLGAVERG